MSTSDTVNPLFTTNEQLAAWLNTGRSYSTDTSLVTPRSSGYGEQMMIDLFGARTPMIAREGSRWVTTNTPGTPITSTNAAAFAATTPALILQNNNPVGGRWVYPVRLKLTATAVGTSSTNWDVQWLVDNVKRYSSGGSTLTPTNSNLNVLAGATGAQVFFGALTATAANASRIIAADRVRTVIKVIGDETIFEFGNSVTKSVGMPTDGTLQLSKTVQVCPVAIPPQCSLLMYEYGASQAAAASFDMLALEYDER